MSGIQFQRSRHRTNGVARALARLQLTVIHLGLDEDEPSRVAEIGCVAGDQRAPGKVGRLSGHRLLERSRQRLELGLDVLELHVAAIDAQQGDVEHLHRPGQAGIGGQRRQQRLHLDQGVRDRPDIVHGQQQQAVALEEPAAIRLAYIVEKIGPLLQRRGEPLCPVIGKFGRRAVDHDHGQVLQLRECLVELDPALAPLQLGRDQLAGLGRHGEVLGEVDEGRRRRRERGKQHDQRMPDADRDDTTDQRSAHGQEAPRGLMRRLAGNH